MEILLYEFEEINTAFFLLLCNFFQSGKDPAEERRVLENIRAYGDSKWKFRERIAAPIGNICIEPFRRYK